MIFYAVYFISATGFLNANAAEVPCEPQLQVINGWYVNRGSVVWGNVQHNAFWRATRVQYRDSRGVLVGPKGGQEVYGRYISIFRRP